MEIDQSRRVGSGSRAFSCGASLARSPRARQPGIAMKGAAIPFPVVIAVMSGIASVRGASDPAAPPRACSVVEKAGQLQCLDKLSRDPAPPLQLALARDGCSVSEATSPVDNSP